MKSLSDFSEGSEIARIRQYGSKDVSVYMLNVCLPAADCRCLCLEVTCIHTVCVCVWQ